MKNILPSLNTPTNWSQKKTASFHFKCKIFIYRCNVFCFCIPSKAKAPRESPENGLISPYFCVFRVLPASLLFPKSLFVTTYKKSVKHKKVCCCQYDNFMIYSFPMFLSSYNVKMKYSKFYLLVEAILTTIQILLTILFL